LSVFDRKHLLLVLCLAFALVFAPNARAASKKIGISGAEVASQPISQTSTSASRQELTVATQAPLDGQTVSGAITWSVSVTGETPSRVDFAIDGSKKWSQASAPYLYGGVSGGLDTRTLSNGLHTLTATAAGSRGARAASTVTVNVQNAPPEPTPEPEPVPAPDAAPLYWGATIGSHLTGSQAPWDMTAVSEFEENAHKNVSLVQFFQPFANCASSPCSFYSFPTTPLNNIRSHGAIPVLSWSSQSIPSTLNEPDFQLSDVIAGRYDSYIRGFATKAKEWGHPFFLRFNWEMNGSWFPWSEGVNGNRAGEYVASWRHVHDIFAEVGASNVTWVWCPNVDYDNNLQKVTSNYPGDAYVDWTGLDGYNWGTNPTEPGGWKSFSQLYRSTYLHIVETVAPSKPLMIGEVASTEYGGSKSAWIKNMVAAIPAEYPKIRALLWFDKFDGGMDWPIETSSSATSGFAEAIQSPAYVESLFSELGSGLISSLG
jgi:mannan endo-1,4-beta-mannosidase